MDDASPKLLAALRRSIAFRDVSERVLRRLVETGERVSKAPGEAIFDQGSEPGGFFVVLRGEVHLYRDEGEDRSFIGAVMEGGCVGDMAVASGKPHVVSAIADPLALQPVELFFVARGRFDAVRESSASLQRNMVEDQSAAPSRSTNDERPRSSGLEGLSLEAHAPERTWSAEVAVLTADPSMRAPLGLVTDLLAQAITLDFGDRVLVLRVVEALSDVPVEGELGEGGVVRADVSLDQTLAWRGEARALVVLNRYDYIFLDLSSLPENKARAARERLAAEGLIHTRVDLRRDPDERRSDPRDVPCVIHAVVLDPSAPSAAPRGVARAIGMMGNLVRGSEPEPETEAPADARHADTCRLYLGVERLAELDRTSPRPSLAKACAHLDAARSERERRGARDCFSYLGRAMTQRQVGLALGGGGAWGFVHVALIRAMAKRKIPVDLIAGASFGSVVGAYHAARPVDGLDLLLSRTSAFQRAADSAVLSSVAFSRVVNKDLDRVRLDELPIRFFPVATDMALGRRVVITTGTVGFGVRASSSFPGIFAPTTVPGARYVDGGIIDNVPVDVISARGADLLVASNVVPPPAPREAGAPRFPGPIGRFLYELDPVGRARDVIRSLFVMMHEVGELESASAHVAFEARPTEAELDFRNFGDATRIMASSAAEVAKTVDRVDAAWKRLSSHRRSRPSAWPPPGVRVSGGAS